MNARYKLLVPAACAALLLAFNNPTSDDLKVEVKDFVYDNAEFKDGLADLGSNELRDMSGLVGSFVVDYGMDITRTNYLLFSTFHVRVNPFIAQHANVDREICYIGLMKSVFVKC